MKAIRWFFTNPESGEVVIAQAPNAPVFVFVAAKIASWVLPGMFGTAAGVLATAAIVLWAVSEIIAGDSPFRRTLGATVLMWTALSWIAF